MKKQKNEDRAKKLEIKLEEAKKKVEKEQSTKRMEVIRLAFEIFKLIF